MTWCSVCNHAYLTERPVACGRPNCPQRARAAIIAAAQAGEEIAETEVGRLRRDCAELYQVIGTMADHCPDDPAIVKALDNASAAAAGVPRTHDDLLPFILPAPAPLGRADDVRERTIEECAKVADQEVLALKSIIACDPYARSRVMHVAHRIRALAASPYPLVQSGEGQSEVVNNIQARLFLVQNASIAMSYCNAASDASKLIGAQSRNIATLTQALAEAEKVIEPFALLSDDADNSDLPDCYRYLSWASLTVGELRRARAFLERDKPKVRE